MLDDVGGGASINEGVADLEAFSDVFEAQPDGGFVEDVEHLAGGAAGLLGVLLANDFPLPTPPVPGRE
jgi:hypothetical protein